MLPIAKVLAKSVIWLKNKSYPTKCLWCLYLFREPLLFIVYFIVFKTITTTNRIVWHCQLAQVTNLTWGGHNFKSGLGWKSWILLVIGFYDWCMSVIVYVSSYFHSVIFFMSFMKMLCITVLFFVVAFISSAKIFSSTYWWNRKP